MAKVVFFLVLAVTMVSAAHSRWIPNPDGDAVARYQVSHKQGRLVNSGAYETSFGSTEVQPDNYQTSLYDQPSRGGEFGQFDRLQEVDTTANSFSDAFATETFPSSLSTDPSFSTESNYVNPAQGVNYNYAAHSVHTQYDEGLARRGAGTGQADFFTLEGNIEKTDSAEWTESSDP